MHFYNQGSRLLAVNQADNGERPGLEPCCYSRSVFPLSLLPAFAMPQPAYILRHPSPAVPDLTGMTVGRFTIRSRLGVGGMGEVYLAEDTKLRRRVALKRMAPALRTDEHYRHRFIKEAERASSLNDQHIAGIYDVLEDRDEMFVVMEYVEGVTLRQRLKEPLTWKEFLPVAAECATASV